MPTADDIHAASGAGIITPAQAESLVAFLAARAAAPAPDSAPAASWASVPVMPAPADPDEESIRFARGFQDVFLTIGIALLLVGVGIAGPLLAGPLALFLLPFGIRDPAIASALSIYSGAVISFLLARYFATRRRLVLPSAALAIGFTLFAGVGTAMLVGADGWASLMPRSGFSVAGRVQLIGGLAALAAAGLFFAVFRLPLTLALIALAASQAVFGLLFYIYGDAFLEMTAPAYLAMGIIIFVVAMAFDVTDPRRQTLRADNAFWLHLVAAPMIVQSIISLLTTGGRFSLTLDDAVSIVALVLFLGLIALIVDRRALLVAGLTYLAFAVARLVSEAHMQGSAGVATTLLVVGGFVVVLGAGWRPARRALLGAFPTGVLRRLPPVASNPAS